MKDWQGLTTSFDYDDNQNLTKEIYPNDATVSYLYDMDDRLTKKINDRDGNPGAQGLEIFEEYDLIYDKVDNVLTETLDYSDQRARGPVESAHREINYTYDDLYRLTNTTDSDGKIAEYTYDSVGNRLREVNNRNFDLIRNGKGTI